MLSNLNTQAWVHPSCYRQQVQHTCNCNAVSVIERKRWSFPNCCSQPGCSESSEAVSLHHIALAFRPPFLRCLHSRPEVRRQSKLLGVISLVSEPHWVKHHPEMGLVRLSNTGCDDSVIHGLSPVLPASFVGWL